jgi:hypothetical protein
MLRPRGRSDARWKTSSLARWPLVPGSRNTRARTPRTVREAVGVDGRADTGSNGGGAGKSAFTPRSGRASAHGAVSARRGTMVKTSSCRISGLTSLLLGSMRGCSFRTKRGRCVRFPSDRLPCMRSRGTEHSVASPAVQASIRRTVRRPERRTAAVAPPSSDHPPAGVEGLRPPRIRRHFEGRAS